METRRFVLGLMAAAPAAAFLARPAFAGEPPIFQSGGVAVNGYDVVAYFTESKPVKGSGDHAVSYMGADFHFASAANAAKFEADPTAYAPQYGGYCAYAVSKGGLAKTDPDAWTVYEGKLYLNFNTTVRGIWSEDIPGNIKRANANWPSVLEG